MNEIIKQDKSSIKALSVQRTSRDSRAFKDNQREISKENQRLLSRLQNSKSSYDVKEWQQSRL